MPRDRIHSRVRHHPAHREVGPVRHSVGPALDHRHDGHALGAGTRPTRPRASADIEYLLKHVNAFLTTRLTQADVEGVYAGLRPLLAGESEQTSKLSREHVVAHPTPGLIVVAGGKYTTYRIMAARGHRRGRPHARRVDPRVDHAGHPDGRRRGVPAMWNRRAALAEESRPARRADREDADAARHPHDRDSRHGRRGAARSATRCPAARTSHRPRIAYAASHEGALHLDDVLARRTRLSIETWDRAVGASRPAAEIVAPFLGGTRRPSTTRWSTTVSASRPSASLADDARRRGGRPRATESTGHQRLTAV